MPQGLSFELVLSLGEFDFQLPGLQFDDCTFPHHFRRKVDKLQDLRSPHHHHGCRWAQ